MKLHKDIQRAINAYALSTIPVMPAPEPIKWENPDDRESKFVMKLQDKINDCGEVLETKRMKNLNATLALITDNDRSKA